MPRRSVPKKSRSARAGLPFRDMGDRVELRLSACPWAGRLPNGEVWVSPSLAEQADGSSGGKVEDAGDQVIFRGGI